MPPKKQEPSKKTEVKKKEKIVEDKTFGLKNKKGAKQQKFVQTVQQQVQMMGKSAKQLAQQEKERLEKNSKKDEKKKTVEELNALFKPVEQKVGKGIDPKSVLCAFFKSGQCTKGDRCKFSHDLNIGRKGEKRSLYDDQREDNDDTMENWDEAKLEEVVNQKHGESDRSKPKTEIICKFFLEAVESSKYGWFWSCPNGDACFYRHALPPGFVLKKDQKKDDKQELISLEDLIERERAALSSQNLTRVTLDSFLKWKEQKRKQKIETAMAVIEKKKNNFAAGKMFGISGRELFEFNPDLIRGDDDEADDGAVYQRESDDEESEGGEVREVNLDMFAEEMQNYVELPTAQKNESRVHFCNGNNGTNDDDDDDDEDDDDEDDDDAENNRLNEAAALPEDEGRGNEMATASGSRKYKMATPSSTSIADDDLIDENLFDGEDLELVEEELDNLELID